jgi:hypothetical protein
VSKVASATNCLTSQTETARVRRFLKSSGALERLFERKDLTSANLSQPGTKIQAASRLQLGFLIK